VPRLSLAALTAAALVLAGCGSSSSTSSSATTSSTVAAASSSTASATPTAFIAPFTTATKLGSTEPANGDVNPYGLVLVPASIGRLRAGELLVSNFNDKQNDQGTGTTIDEITTAGKSSLFASVSAKSLPGSCPGGVGLTTALNVLPGGYVVVGSLPTTNGKSATAQYGCLIVLDSAGKVVETIAGAQIQGPWDSTAVSHGSMTTLFVSNALNGGAKKGIHTIDNSTVLRIDLESGPGQPPKVLSQQVIADHIPWVDSPEALVVGPTGLALAADGTLYLADTLANRITAIPNAMTRATPAPSGGTTVTEGGHLKEPLGLVLAPNADIITTNAGDGNIVETTPSGKQLVAQTADTKTGAGSLFGLADAPGGTGVYYVDDGENALRLLHASTAPASSTATIDAAANAKLHQTVLVDPQGRTLYVLSPETAKHVLCTSVECLKFWPPLTVPKQTANAALAAGVHGTLGILHRSNGMLQVTLNGQPLYRFDGDHAGGEVNGQDFKSFGGIWHALSDAGTPISTSAAASAQAPTSTAPSTSTQTSSSPGYEY
jgi:predicted lipoprotein with Yx(FWY)xxD motif